MLDTLLDLIREELILERLSPTARRVRRSRSMGIEFEFASDKSAPAVTDLLNELLGKTRAFGTRLKFQMSDIWNKKKDGGGVPRHFIVTTDPSAAHGSAHRPDSISFEEMAEDLSRDMAKEIVDSYGEYEREWYGEESGRVKEELEEKWHEAVDQVVDLLDKSEDSDEIRGLIDGLRSRSDENIEKLEKFADLLDSDPEAAWEAERPDFDYDQVAAWIKRLNVFYRKRLADVAKVDEDDLVFHEHRGPEDIESRMGDGPTEWSDVTERWIKKNYGEDEARYFDIAAGSIVRNEGDIWKGLSAWIIQSKPKKIVDKFESLNLGLEINSPRLAFTEKGIAEASHVFELIYKTLNDDKRINIHTHSEAGLHVHIGVGDDIKDIHLIRLLYDMSENESELASLAQRDPDEWFFTSLRDWKQGLDASIQKAMEEKDPKHVEDQLEAHGAQIIGGERNRELIANLHSVRDKGTVEIRLGSSQLASSGALGRWLTKVQQIFQNAVSQDFLEVEGGHRLTVDGRNIHITSPDEGGMHHTAVKSKATYHLYGFEPGQELQGMTRPGESREQMRNAGGPLTARPPGFHRRARKAQKREVEQLPRESFSGAVKRLFGDSAPDLDLISGSGSAVVPEGFSGTVKRIFGNADPFSDDTTQCQPVVEALSKKELAAVKAIASGHSPFQEWIDKDSKKIDDRRVLLGPFKASGKNITLNAEMRALTNALGEVGYTDIDLANGRAKRGGRDYRIGRILSRANPDLRELIVKLFNEEMNHFSPGSELSGDEVFNDISKAFQNRSIPKTETPYYVMISNDPVDIARMSEGRGWYSCTNIKQYSKLYFEVACGGMAAYIVPEKYQIDKAQGVTNPIARIHLRNAFRVNRKNHEATHTLVQEYSIYGTDVLGNFRKIIDDWIKSHGGSIKGTVSGVTGSPYSDTWASALDNPAQYHRMDYDLGVEEKDDEWDEWGGGNQSKKIRIHIYGDGNEFDRIEVGAGGEDEGDFDLWNEGGFDEAAWKIFRGFKDNFHDLADVLGMEPDALRNALKPKRDKGFHKIVYAIEGHPGIGHIVMDNKTKEIFKDDSPLTNSMVDVILGKEEKILEMEPKSLEEASTILTALPDLGSWVYEPEHYDSAWQEQGVFHISYEDGDPEPWYAWWEIEDPWAGESGVHGGGPFEGEVYQGNSFRAMVKALRKETFRMQKEERQSA